MDVERIDQLMKHVPFGRIIETAPGEAVPLAEFLRTYLIDLVRDERRNARMLERQRVADELGDQMIASAEEAVEVVLSLKDVSNP